MTDNVLITGIGGQDGSYLAEMLLSRGDHVTGLVIRGEPLPPVLITHLVEDPKYSGRLDLVVGDLQEQTLFFHLLRDVNPDLIFHLAALSSVVQIFHPL